MPTEEEIAKMSPEELAELQKQNCIFCQIATGKIPAKTAYADETCVAVLDINPAAKGHMLLLTKEHYAVLPQLPEEALKHLFIVCKKLSQAALKGLQCKGTTIFVANGVAAGQRAPHFMVHIIPRNENDNLPFTIPQTTVPHPDLEAMASVLRRTLGLPGGSAGAGAGAHAGKSQEAKQGSAQKTEGDITATNEPSMPESPERSQEKRTLEPTKKQDEFDLDKVTELLGGKGPTKPKESGRHA